MYVKKIDLSDNRALTAVRWATISKSLQGKRVDELNVASCALTDEKVAQISFQLMDVKKIDFSENDEITASGWGTIGVALQGKHLDELNVSKCSLTD